MFSFGIPELLVLMVVVLMIIGVPAAIVTLLVILLRKQNATDKSPGYAELQDENQRLRDEIAVLKKD